MEEIAKCPLCYKQAKKHIWNPKYEGCSAPLSVTFTCCGHTADTIDGWNRYAAAIELTANEAWFKEVLDIKSYIGFDEKNPRSNKNKEYNRIWEESYNDLNNAYERALMVFK